MLRWNSLSFYICKIFAILDDRIGTDKDANALQTQFKYLTKLFHIAQYVLNLLTSLKSSLLKLVEGKYR